MKIGIDVRLFKQTGVGRYIRNLVTELAKIDQKNEYVLFARTQDLSDIQISNTNFKIVVADIAWHGLAEQVKFPKLLNKHNLDLMHFPYFSVPLFYNEPFVITVHDLIVNKFATGRASTLPFPLYAAKRVGYSVVMASAVRRAKKIIVPSEAVGEDLARTYKKVNKSKIKITYEGGFDENIKIPKGKTKIKGKYFLRVGNYYPHKNVEALLAAFGLSIDERKASKQLPKLILVGKKDYFYERMEQMVQKLGIGSNVLFLDKIDDEELIGLYKNAIATIIPSFAEGFSLTAVEAMVLGCPVVASGIPVHHEVCGDAAIYFDPQSIENIAERIGFALDLNDSSRADLIEQGKKQSKKFSWHKMAKETLGVYNSSV